MIRLLVALAVLALLVFVGSLALPSSVAVERSIVIERPQGQVFDVVNGFRHFPAWSPWADKDPEIDYRFEGPRNGVGAAVRWSGDPSRVPSGRQQIVSTQRPDAVATRLDFDQQGSAESRFTLAPAPDGTALTWRFETALPEGLGMIDGVVWRWMAMFYENWVGADYEQGLENLKAYVERLPPADPGALDVEVVEVQARPILYVSGRSAREPDAVAAAMADAYAALSQHMLAAGIAPDGAPLAITREWSDSEYRFDAAIPVSEPAVRDAAPVRAGHTPEGTALRVVHVGPYDKLQPTYAQIQSWLATHAWRLDSVSWEHYVTDPGDTPAEALRTHVYVLLEEATR